MSKFDAQFAGRLDGQTVLVTGTTKGGIGHETAQGAGNSGATVLVHARHADHARRAVDLLVSNGNGKGQYLAVAGDLGSLAGVRELVKAVHQASPKGLNGLVNNAGAAFATKALSPDGYERTIAINHIAVAALTEGLLDLLRKGADDFAAPSRVVNMTALIESRGNPIADWSYPGKYSQMHAYADAKLLALMYTYAMARRHQGDGLTFNAVSPGTVNSGFGGRPAARQDHPGADEAVRRTAGEGLARLCPAAGRSRPRHRHRRLLKARPSSKSHPRSLVTMTLRTGCTSRPNANCASTTRRPSRLSPAQPVRHRSCLH